ncbi:hypothetical protein A3H65_02570 [Candidatus Giovannonibacteria bacterium RIFCSPLOWO2_02_FULL_45_14]|uniref:Uncharacterized protein n=1 Tax=Candidatus Giovannonibacteria bacterium RIFCSPLOWO2_12_FULL_44_15 TaxID=1798364 RepID=A0A1F5Y149_9BACT|nr:MAG: hypothetical protein A3C75_00235 [Candidatus Giovannonibacteria bacterium RIFCSPHIGHO2_02_FULL_44_31]OGF76942.1 MAG: hypothetical protein A3E62_01225 [Candidatus Giovannonibacteria bacterium RIFCSPHIGHO2_12_FULL_44_29]OGF90443.1 MAG: hypothetical protein A3H65_02570 [Candidatus Giovannonibacteria bacterium RIFCSPLOWO2_02_FULL_45_14]OGF93874.1 MAG: hypothetical protein A3G54_02810 [Candidatus Giovannonibacteria bacterium RIFCSPLOWO2_12_FULL_44_15]
MRIRRTQQFLLSYEQAPAHVQKAFDQKVGFLLENLRHPSLRSKKYDETRDIWQARVTESWRFYFRIEKDSYVILNIISHPK